MRAATRRFAAPLWRASAALVAAAGLLAHSAVADTDTLRIGVSWSYFQEERWKTDEAALRGLLEARGATVLSADAQASTEKQIADIEGLVARGADVLVIVPHDADALGPAVAAVKAEGIPVIAYDRLIAQPGVLYLSFDNREVGRLQARAVLEAAPSGRYVYVKGAPTDPNSDFVHAGQLDVLAPVVEAGRVSIVGDQYVDGWLPERAQQVMEQILTANDNRVDAVVCSNDGMAGGVIAALADQGLDGIPVSGQDGDHAALNRVARGLQTVSVWKDARELGRRAGLAALALARGEPVEGTRPFRLPSGISIPSVLLDPVPITRDRLDRVIDAGWVSRDAVCRGTGADPPPACR